MTGVWNVPSPLPSAAIGRPPSGTTIRSGLPSPFTSAAADAGTGTEAGKETEVPTVKPEAEVEATDSLNAEDRLGAYEPLPSKRALSRRVPVFRATVDNVGGPTRERCLPQECSPVIERDFTRGGGRRYGRGQRYGLAVSGRIDRTRERCRCGGRGNLHRNLFVGPRRWRRWRPER